MELEMEMMQQKMANYSEGNLFHSDESDSNSSDSVDDAAHF